MGVNCASIARRIGISVKILLHGCLNKSLDRREIARLLPHS